VLGLSNVAIGVLLDLSSMSAAEAPSSKRETRERRRLQLQAHVLKNFTIIFCNNSGMLDLCALGAKVG
jgi:hypothetical protein